MNCDLQIIQSEDGNIECNLDELLEGRSLTIVDFWKELEKHKFVQTSLKDSFYMFDHLSFITMFLTNFPSQIHSELKFIKYDEILLDYQLINLITFLSKGIVRGLKYRFWKFFNDDITYDTDIKIDGDLVNFKGRLLVTKSDIIKEEIFTIKLIFRLYKRGDGVTDIKEILYYEFNGNKKLISDYIGFKNIKKWIENISNSFHFSQTPLFCMSNEFLKLLETSFELLNDKREELLFIVDKNYKNIVIKDELIRISLKSDKYDVTSPKVLGLVKDMFT